jgi:hypothetical protein
MGFQADIVGLRQPTWTESAQSEYVRIHPDPSRSTSAYFGVEDVQVSSRWRAVLGQPPND